MKSVVGVVVERGWLERTMLWDGQTRIDSINRAELTTETLLDRADLFAQELLAWETEHPPISFGWEPYPLYGLAA